MYWIPTSITIMRLLLAPVLAYSVLEGELLRAFWIGLFCSATDFLDGFLARRFGWTSRIGAWLDAVADKLLLSLCFISLALTLHMPLWYVGIALGRDVLILLFSGIGLLFTTIRDFPPSWLGKISTVLQLMTGAIVLLELEPAIRPFLLGSAAVTLLSGLHYFYRAILKLHELSNQRALNPIDEISRGM